MNEQELAGEIVQHLDRGLGDIKQGTLYQLRSARLSALDGHREVPQRVFGLAWAGGLTSYFGDGGYFNLNVRRLVLAALLLLGSIGAVYWQISIQGNDIAAIDASLLTDDLPIDAYLDRDFEAWLKRSSQ